MSARAASGRRHGLASIARAKPGPRCSVTRFAGFAPADNPRFTVYVVLRHPHGAASGGGTAGPVFRQIMSHLLQKYDVPPTGTAAPDLNVYW